MSRHGSGSLGAHRQRSDRSLTQGVMNSGQNQSETEGILYPGQNGMYSGVYSPYPAQPGYFPQPIVWPQGEMSGYPQTPAFVQPSTSNYVEMLPVPTEANTDQPITAADRDKLYPDSEGESETTVTIDSATKLLPAHQELLPPNQAQDLKVATPEKTPEI